MTSDVPGSAIDPLATAFSQRERRWMMCILIFATALSSIDRQVLGMLLEPIRKEFELSDTQIGLLSGPAFTVLYAAFALPLAVLSDRGSRRAVVAASLAAFSAMSVACGMAVSFGALVLFRMGVAVGEAGVVPSSQAMVAELYPKKQLTLAMSNLYLSGAVGGVLAFVLGGLLSGLVGWRWTLILLGLPGVAVAILSLMVLPRRKRAPDGSAAADRPIVPLTISLKFLWSQRTYLYLTLANAVWSFAGAGIALWSAPFVSRTYGLPPLQVGLILAVAAGLAGAAGLFVIGAIAQRKGAADARWILWVVALGLIAAVPLAALTFLAPSGQVALIAGCLFAFFAISTQGPVASVVQLLVPREMRSIAVAVKHVVVTAVGAGSGPLVIGILNDSMTARFGDQAIRYSLVLVSIAYAGAAWLFYHASRSFVADAASADTWRTTSSQQSVEQVNV